MQRKSVQVLTVKSVIRGNTLCQKTAQNVNITKTAIAIMAARFV
jgi:hypothetical protein